MKFSDFVYQLETDDQGRRIFYPNGPLGKGYYLPDENFETRIKKIQRNLIILSIVLTVLPFLVIGYHIPISFVRTYYIVGLFLLLVGYFSIIVRFVKKLQTVENKPTFKERFIKVAKRAPTILLWPYLVLVLFFITRLSTQINSGQMPFKLGLLFLSIMIIALALVLSLIVVKRKNT